MKLTWTFYPKYEKAVTLTVTYLPQLDKSGDWGFLHVDSNQAWVSWDCFRSFDKGDVKTKRDAFERLSRIDSQEDLYKNVLLL